MSFVWSDFFFPTGPILLFFYMRLFFSLSLSISLFFPPSPFWILCHLHQISPSTSWRRGSVPGNLCPTWDCTLLNLGSRSCSHPNYPQRGKKNNTGPKKAKKARKKKEKAKRSSMLFGRLSSISLGWIDSWFVFSARTPELVPVTIVLIQRELHTFLRLHLVSFVAWSRQVSGER